VGGNGVAEAQHRLWFMPASGYCVAQNYVQAHKWFNLAAAQDVENGKKGRDIVAKKMTSSQIEKAQTLAAEWRPKK
jgi:TPR repeat protein